MYYRNNSDSDISVSLIMLGICLGLIFLLACFKSCSLSETEYSIKQTVYISDKAVKSYRYESDNVIYVKLINSDSYDDYVSYKCNDRVYGILEKEKYYIIEINSYGNIANVIKEVNESDLQ